MDEDVWAILLKEQEQLEESRADCAWCLAESGEEMGEGSHGICDEHAEEQYQQWRASRSVA